MLGHPTSIPLSEAMAGVYGADGKMRFGVVSDPVTGVGDVLFAKIAQTDPDTKGAGCKRVELADQMGSLPVGKPFTLAFKTRCAVSGTTDQQIIWQWLKQDGQLLEMVVSGDTARLGLYLASGYSVIWTGAISPSEWSAWEIGCYLGDAGGWLKMRRNGVLLVDYLGPVGSSVTAAYWKVGLYKWNVWDMRRTERHMWLTLPDVMPTL